MYITYVLESNLTSHITFTSCLLPGIPQVAPILPACQQKELSLYGQHRYIAAFAFRNSANLEFIEP